MLKTLLVPAVSAAVLLSGCATILPEQQPDMVATRTYADSRDAVWRRILSTSARKAMFIRQADQANGVITVDREIALPQTAMFGGSILDWADCPASLTDRTLLQRIEVNYVVRKEQDGRTTVTLNGRFTEHRSKIGLQQKHWVTCTSTGALEKDLLDSFYYDYRN